MRSLIAVLSNRELALITWGAIGLLFACIRLWPEVRNVLRAFFVCQILTPLLVMAVYVICITLTLKSLGLWDTGLLKDTIFWFVASATVTLFGSIQKGKENPSFFRELLIDNIKLAIVLEFVVDTFVMPLGWELLLVPVAFFLGAIKAAVDIREENAILRKPINFLVTCLSLWILGYAMLELIAGFKQFTTLETFKEFMIAPMLTVGTIPFFFLFAVWGNYQEHFIRTPLWLRGRPELVKYANLQTVLQCGFNLRRLSLLKGKFYTDLAEAGDKASIRRVIQCHAHPTPIDSANVMTGEVVRVRIEPYTLPGNGLPAQMVLIDWTNTSNRPAASAWADVTPFDSNGKLIEGGVKDKCIFAYEDNSMQKIKPGETYREPDDFGFILFPMIHGEASRVEARIVRLEEE